MSYKFDKCISLGFFCGISIDLKSHGYRDGSYPFDWVLSDFKQIIELEKNNYKNFIIYKTLFQDTKNRRYFFCKSSNIWFYHDFSEKVPLWLYYSFVRRKYKRRIKRFLSLDRNKTLFIRYCENLEESNWIKNNIQAIQKIFPNILFVSSIPIDNVPNVFLVKNDDGKNVCELPLSQNEALLSFIKNTVSPVDSTNKPKKHSIFKTYLKILSLVFRKTYHFKRTI